jgi:TRAP transporter TAXI family solute receptor
MFKRSGKLLFLLMLVGLLLTACSSSSDSSTTPSTSTQTNETSKESNDGTQKEGTQEKEKIAIRIGTSSSGSPFYTIAVGLSEIINKHAAHINSTAEPVGGSNPNIFALEQDKVDFAIVNALSAYGGYYAEAPFKNPVDLRLVAQGQPTIRQIIVRADSGIESISDLAGKKIIAKRPPLPEIEQIANAILEAYDIPKDKVDLISTTDTTEALEALKIGSVDAAILPASLKAANITDLMSDGKFRFISVDDSKMDEVLALLPKAIVKGVIPAGTYPNQEQDINVFTFNTYLVVKGDVSDDTVYHVIKTLYDNFEEFSGVHATAKQWTIETTLDGPTIPYHPGAIQYFEEIGKWDENLKTLQSTLEKR